MIGSTSICTKSAQVYGPSFSLAPLKLYLIIGGILETCFSTVFVCQVKSSYAIVIVARYISGKKNSVCVCVKSVCMYVLRLGSASRLFVRN